MTRLFLTAASAALGIGCLAVALLGSAQLTDWLLRCATLVILATSWNLMANAGMISLGHSAFWGVGSFAAVLSINVLGLPVAVAFGPAVLAGALVGAFLARTTGRLSGIFFAISTLALSEGLRVIALMLPEVTGGAAGLFVKAAVRPEPRSITVAAVAIAILCVGIAYALSRSRYHFALRGMRNDEASVQMIGVDPLKFRLGTTVLSGAMASTAGAISACYTGYLDPEVAFSLDHTIMAQIAPILGGLYTVAGPVIGSFAIVVLAETTRIWLGTRPGLSLFIFGFLLALCIRFMPLGILGQLGAWYRRAEGLRARRRATPEAGDPLSPPRPLEQP